MFDLKDMVDTDSTGGGLSYHSGLAGQSAEGGGECSWGHGGPGYDASQSSRDRNSGYSDGDHAKDFSDDYSNSSSQSTYTRDKNNALRKHLTDDGEVGIIMRYKREDISKRTKGACHYTMCHCVCHVVTVSAVIVVCVTVAYPSPLFAAITYR